MDLHPARISGFLERGPRAIGELGDALDRMHLGRELGKHCGLVAGARAESSTRSWPCRASSEQIRATMYGWEIVWP